MTRITLMHTHLRTVFIYYSSMMSMLGNYFLFCKYPSRLGVGDDISVPVTHISGVNKIVLRFI